MLPTTAKHLRKLPFIIFCTLALAATGNAQQHSFDSIAGQTAPATAAILDRDAYADMAFLADDDLHGRGSATRDEHIAALFAAAQFQALGLEPGGDHHTFVQKSALPHPLPASLQQRLSHFEDTPRRETWNVIAILRGTAQPATQPAVQPASQRPSAAEEIILLTAHLDHLGRGPAAPGSTDTIYNGADDDASGTTAVLALAHILALDPRPRRTIVFALFGSEEIGGYGNAAFLKKPPIPLTSIIANLEFEMIGRPDPAIPAGALWLTGFDRSNLGPELVRHGANLLPDPHPKEQFFTRSDNYALAQQGVIAHTVSSFGLHKDYHHPSDDLSTIDFTHMTAAIASMIDPIRWLAGSDFKPTWSPGRNPSTNSPSPRATRPTSPSD